MVRDGQSRSDERVSRGLSQSVCLPRVFACIRLRLLKGFVQDRVSCHPCDPPCTVPRVPRDGHRCLRPPQRGTRAATLSASRNFVRSWCFVWRLVKYHCWLGLVAADVAVLWWQIDDFVADTIISQLLLLDANNPRKDIRLFINCSGGSLNAAMAIYDAVQLVRADVSTIALGIAASTAAIVLAGEPPRGHRLSLAPHSCCKHPAADDQVAAEQVWRAGWRTWYKTLPYLRDPS